MNLSLATTKRVRSLSPNKHPYHQLKKWGRFGYKNHAMDTDRFNNRNTNIYSAFHYDALALNKSPQLDSNFNKLLYKKQIESYQAWKNANKKKYTLCLMPINMNTGSSKLR